MNNQLLILLCLCSLTGWTQTLDSFLVAPYLQWGTSQSMKVLWETDKPSKGKVYYGPAVVRAEQVTFIDSVISDEYKSFHEVDLTGLDTAQKYLYQVSIQFQDGQTYRSGISTFQTSVRSDDALFFALVGDSQYSSRSPGKWGEIAELVWKERPHFIIHAGDLVDVGTRKTDWTEYFLPLGNIAMSRFPMYSVLGNHEQDADFYYQYMANPKPEYYYTFTYGKTQFFMIDSNRDCQEGSEQYNWLEWELAKSTADWKFVVHHHPPYSSEENDHGDTYVGASTQGTHTRNLVPLYEAYQVDFCLFGHTHLYERTWPLLENRVNQKNGVTYINSGGAGGGLEDFDPVRAWFSKEIQTGHHYCTFAIHENHLSFKAIDDQGRLFDYFTVNKDADSRKVSILTPPSPKIEVDQSIFPESTRVSITAIDSTYFITYTLDGSNPTTTSSRYEGPFIIDRSAQITARCFTMENEGSRSVTEAVVKMEPQRASKVETDRGLEFFYYEGEWEGLPDFDTVQIAKKGITKTASLDDIGHRENHFGVVLKGFIEVPETGMYTLYTYSDDGSKLYLNDQLLIDSDGRRSAKYVYGSTILQKGKHALRIEYFEGSGNNFLYSGFVRAGNDRVPFTPFQLHHPKP